MMAKTLKRGLGGRVGAWRLGAFVACLAACGGEVAPVQGASNAAAMTREASDSMGHCALEDDPMRIKVCRAERRLRLARRDSARDRFECYDERVGQMHAAERARREAARDRRERAALGFQGGDEAAKMRVAERRVNELWDQIQSGVCEVAAP